MSMTKIVYTGHSGGELIRGEEYHTVLKLGQQKFDIIKDNKVIGVVIGDEIFKQLFKIARDEFIVYISGNGRSKKSHPCLAEAELEARDLSSMPEYIGKDIHVFKIVKTYKSEVVVREAV